MHDLKKNKRIHMTNEADDKKVERIQKVLWKFRGGG